MIAASRVTPASMFRSGLRACRRAAFSRCALACGLALVALTGCRPKEGERCLCADECRGGLVCAADGAVLQGDQCVGAVSGDLESGTCVDAGNVDQSDNDLNPPPRFDAGSWATDGNASITSAGTGPGASDTEVGSTEGESSSSTAGESSSSGSSSSSSSGTDTDTTSGSSGAASSSSSSSDSGV